MPFGVKVTDARCVLESLRPHRAGIHPQPPPDRAGNSFHPFKPAEICRTRGVSHLPQLYARACGDFAPVDLHFLEIAAVRMNDYPADAAVANKKIRSASDCE